MRLATIVLLVSQASASTLFIGSYGGQIITANLEDTTGALSEVHSSSSSAPGPSWQEISPDGKILYTVEESAVANRAKGAVTSYRIESNGGLTKIASSTGLSGPVSLAISPDGKTIFTASYSYSGVSVYSTNNEGAVSWVRDWKFTLPTPGPVPERQDAPHPHQALFDYSGRFVLIPDLGADVIRVFRVSSPNCVVEMPAIGVMPGSGPRHGVFYPATGVPRFYYLVCEVSNSVVVYSVSYSEINTIVLTQVQTIGTLPTPTTTEPSIPWATPSAAEIAIPQDGRFVYVSNRNDKVFGSAGTHSVAAFEREDATGLLSLLQYENSGVKNPRHISLDPTGTWLLTQGQDSQNIKVFRRDQDTGRVGATPAAELNVRGGPVCVQWLPSRADAEL